MIIDPSAAGKFYPKYPEVLRQEVRKLLSQAKDKTNLVLPKAIIAPHAGYVYSGPIAASAYACLKNAKKQIERVVILAPSHHYFFYDIAATDADFYLTPLGKIKIDHEAIKKLSSPYIKVLNNAFITGEHSIEVHLPFLQLTLKKFSLVPLVVGFTPTDRVEEILENLWGGPETLIIVSSDLSHYLSYESAQDIDKKTANNIVKLKSGKVESKDVCGATVINSLLAVAAKKRMKMLQIDLRNSGDTGGPKDNVVGYGAFHLVPS